MDIEAAHAGFPARKGGAKRIAARAALARVLWDARGRRRLPGQRALDAALQANDPRDLEWMFELSPLAPLYLLPTRAFVNALAKQIRALKVKRVLEVAAGDGYLAQSLQRVAPELQVTASDSGAWSDPTARMSAAERRLHRHAPGLALGSNVERLDAARAIRRHQPELVLCSWLPPGHMLDALVRSRAQYVLEIGAGNGITGSAYSWRFAHEFLEGALERSARCRLDVSPRTELHSRVTLYFARGHEFYFEERVQRGDWLYQFRPQRVRGR
jgi:SAM-dependent methyltransferase